MRRNLRILIAALCTILIYQAYLVIYHLPNSRSGDGMKVVQAMEDITQELKPGGRSHAYTSDHEPLWVIIISYQRTGSSFLGNLFSQHPQAFYAFEPLDGLYVAMYGTSPGYNVPSDITTHWNGTSRALASEDITATTNALEGLLNCSHSSSLPVEMQVHDFWIGYRRDHRNLNDFLQCLRANDAEKLLSKNCSKAANVMLRHCGTWLGKNPKSMRICHSNLWPLSARSHAAKPFARYLRCIDDRRNVAEKCVPHMERVCRNASIRATKVVRPAMASLASLLERHSNIKVLQLFRKPQAVAKSRLKFSSVRGHSSGKNMVKEAKLYCKDAIQDLKLRRELEKQYLNTFKTVIYEEFVKNSSVSAIDIYSFLGGQKVPEKVLKYFNTQQFVPDRKSGWNVSHDPSSEKTIATHCHELYKYLDYYWD